MSYSYLRALVTAGGTSVPLDGVRSVGNRSKGGFGVALANELAVIGINVTLLATEYAQLKYRIDPRVSVVLFETFDQYLKSINELTLNARQNNQPFDFVLLAAAVSDFAPEVSEGKIASDSSMSIRFDRLPKIIDQARDLFGKTAYLVGFKLLPLLEDDCRSVLSLWRAKERLIEAARKQNHRAHLNLTIANFSPWGDQKSDTVYGVKPDGNALVFGGSFEQRTRAIVNDIVRRQKTTWMKSVPCEMDSPISEAGFQATQRALAFMQKANLFVGSAGNLTVQLPNANNQATDFLVTPRARPNKSTMAANEMVRVNPLFPLGVMCYEANDSGYKPSIDSAVNTRLLSCLPFSIVMHFHDGWVLDAAKTHTDYPCGTAEEAGAVLEAMASSQCVTQSCEPEAPIMVHLVQHGHSLFCNAEDLDYYSDVWQLTLSEHNDHLKDVDQDHLITQLIRRPIWLRGAIIGLVAELPGEDWVSLYVAEKYRKSGLGARVVQMAIEKHKLIAVHDNCQATAGVVDYYIRFGYKTIQKKNGLIILLPPSLQDKVIEAATIRVYAPQQKSVLMGQRSHGPWKDKWVNVGGLVKPNETPWQAALREVGEELVGFPDFVQEPKSRSIHYVAEPGTDRVFRITCFHVDLPFTPDCQVNPIDGELTNCAWIKLSDLHNQSIPPVTRLSLADLVR